jgi:hypothetical protein
MIENNSYGWIYEVPGLFGLRSLLIEPADGGRMESVYVDVGDAEEKHASRREQCLF